MSITALEIANAISMRIIHMPAQIVGNHPILSEIYSEMSAQERILAGLAPWTWLKSTVDVNSYAVSTVLVSMVKGNGVNASSAALRTSPQALKTEYMAQKITTPTNYLVSPINLSVFVQKAGTGAGIPSGVLTAMICPDLNGVPDINNPTITADVLSPDFDSANNPIQLIYLFAGNTTVLLKNTAYWVVFEWQGAADNGDGLYILYSPDGNVAQIKTMLAGTSSFSISIAGDLFITMNYYQSDYINNITMPATVTRVTEMHTGDDTDRPVSLVEYSNDRFIQSGLDLPPDTFCVRSVSNNQVKLFHNSGTPSLVYTCECELAPVAITTGTQYMLCPDAGIDWIINKSAMVLGADKIDDAFMARYEREAATVKENMEFKYISKTEGRRLEKPGFTRGGIQQTRYMERRTNGR